MKVMATKRVEFCYGHFLKGYDGKCKNMHGHNAVLEATVSRTIGEASYPGMVVDFGELKRVLAAIVEKLDHNLINDVLGVDNPTAEVMGRWIFNELQIRVPGGLRVEKILLSETPDSWVEVVR